jgi:site-specific recombinase XerD
MTTQAIVPTTDYSPIVSMVLDGLTSEHSKDAYGRAIRDYLQWWDDNGRPPMVKATVLRYKVEALESAGLSPSTVNLRLSAIRKLAAEAADNGLLEQEIANGISRVKGVRAAGVRSGNWLNRHQAQALINAPDISTLLGLRDRAVLAVLIGTGVRRSEAAALTFGDIQQRNGRWAFPDLSGKGGRVRTVPVPSWCKAAVDAWAEAAHLESGRVFRAVNRYGRTLNQDSESITPQVIFRIVTDYGERLGYKVTPHDLRRTFAKLARKGGAEMTQIQLTLGHATLKTTEGYVNEDQDLTTAPCDMLGLNISGD